MKRNFKRVIIICFIVAIACAILKAKKERAMKYTYFGFDGIAGKSNECYKNNSNDLFCKLGKNIWR